MPSTMIHLQLANKINPNASGEFYLGNFAPDAIDARIGVTREIKDKQHFRSTADRMGELIRLAKKINPRDEFNEGYLIHLFLDKLWDESAFVNYAAHDTAEGWFLRYRSEITLASSYIFYNEQWCGNVWDKIMNSVPNFIDGVVYPETDEIYAYRDSCYSYLINNRTEPSAFFVPEYVDRFTDSAMLQYKDFCRYR